MESQDKSYKRKGLHEDFRRRLVKTYSIAKEKASNQWFSIETFLSWVSYECGVRTAKAKEYYNINKNLVNEGDSEQWIEDNNGNFMIKIEGEKSEK